MMSTTIYNNISIVVTLLLPYYAFLLLQVILDQQLFLTEYIIFGWDITIIIFYVTIITFTSILGFILQIMYYWVLENKIYQIQYSQLISPFINQHIFWLFFIVLAEFNRVFSQTIPTFQLSYEAKEILILYLIIPLLNILLLLVAIAMFTLAERKLMAAMQRRKGPNVVGFAGLLQPIADGFKLILKEIVIPTKSNPILFLMGPKLSLFLSLVSWVAIPFSYSSIIIDLNLGLLFLLSISSLNVYGLLISGWASNSKYAQLGAIRSIAQMISYEISISLCILPVIVLSGSLNLVDIVYKQESVMFIFMLWPFFILFFISVLAETNRAPFDLPEAEAEIVAGYNIEYSSIVFAMFFLAEYCNMLLMSALTAILFFGGWLPLISSNQLINTGIHITHIATETSRLLAILFDLLFWFTFTILGDFDLVYNIFKSIYLIFYKAFLIHIDLLFKCCNLHLGEKMRWWGIYLSEHIDYFWWDSSAAVPAISYFEEVLFYYFWFPLKIVIVCFLFILIRGILPRYRYDQLMILGWKKILPLLLGLLFFYISFLHIGGNLPIENLIFSGGKVQKISLSILYK